MSKHSKWMGTLAAIAAGGLLVVSAAYADYTKTSESQGRMVPRTQTAEVAVYLPLTAKVVKVMCFSNMEWGSDNDLPHGKYKEAPCGSNGGSASFDKPEIETTSSNVVIKTLFHNRSTSHDRDAKLAVTWTDKYN